MIVEAPTITKRYLDIRSKTEQICSRLTPEDHVVQPVVDVSPPKWHMGHTTWFFETFVLIPYKSGYKEYNAQYNYLFNSYYETVGARVIRTNRGNLTRPTVSEVVSYRKYVDEQMQELLHGELNEEMSTLVELGLQHEQQHQELLYYDVKYILGNNPLFPSYIESNTPSSNSSSIPGFIEVPNGTYTIGYEGPEFHYDNEEGIHQVFLHDYGIMNRLVTNEEYLEFIESGGYTSFQYWLSEGWDWVKNDGITSPFHWYKDEGIWYRYSLNGGLEPVDPYAPVSHISFYEANAFAKWKGMRLPTEFEWEVACRQHGRITANSNFTDLEAYDCLPQQNNDNQFYGDLWEWTGSAYRPYPFYEAPEGAVGEYNGKFMINQMVLRGGSCATPRDHIRSTYRNFFHPNLRWMFSGFRLAKYLK